MNVQPLNAPTTQPEQAVLTLDQQKAQDVIDRGDYQAMLRDCLPSLRAELYAAEFMHAEMTGSRDVQLRKKKFMKAAGKIVGGLPPMTETALRVVANSARA